MGRYAENYKRDIRSGLIKDWQEHKKGVEKARGKNFINKLKQHWTDNVGGI